MILYLRQKVSKEKDKIFHNLMILLGGLGLGGTLAR